MFPKFMDETIPPQDVPVSVRHGCEVEPLCDKSSIAEEEIGERESKGQERALQSHY
jgi:hypothetical protein